MPAEEWAPYGPRAKGWNATRRCARALWIRCPRVRLNEVDGSRSRAENEGTRPMESVGVDACRQGWVAVRLDRGRFHDSGLYPDLAGPLDEVERQWWPWTSRSG